MLKSFTFAAVTAVGSAVLLEEGIDQIWAEVDVEEEPVDITEGEEVASEEVLVEVTTAVSATV